MPLHDLQDWLASNQGFRAKYMELLTQDVSSQFPALLATSGQTVEPDWEYLLFCASILSSSDSGEAREMALRIAQACIAKPNSTNEERDAATVVLDYLSNRRAISLAESRKYIIPALPARLGASARLQWARRTIENSIFLADDTVLNANQFQREFWRASEQNGWVSSSAATSVGKSFIVLQRILEAFRQRPSSTVIYIVPTRALIHQVETDFRELALAANLARINVSSIPVNRSLKIGHGNFLVFTQERAHIFLTALDEALIVDLLVVDEAHKVGDRQRGILLQDIVEQISDSNPACKVLFASPMTENPQLLLEDAPPGTPSEPVSSSEVTVNQNLIWVNQIPRQPKVWEVSLCLPESIESLGQLNLEFSPTNISKRLPFVAHALSGHTGGNVIYVDGAADAEKIAAIIFGLLGDEADQSHNGAIFDLISLVRGTIHEKYSLATVLQRGVAFHYGNMPLLVRTEIERLFREGQVKYLICTSTLIEGVNLPCQNIFVRGPKKGRNTPMNENDFWNLAGRAGRWGYEFQGNVVCVDTSIEEVWNGRVPRVRRRYRLERSTDKLLSKPGELIQYLRDEAPRDKVKERPDLEYMASYLMSTVIRAGSINRTNWSKKVEYGTRIELEEILAAAASRLGVDSNIILRNPGISPFAMDRLLTYFRERTKPIEELLPASPDSADASSTYIGIFHRIQKHLAPVFGFDSRIAAIGYLTVDWMRGYPLKRIITNRIKRAKERGLEPKHGTIIRETMKDIEEIVRFQAPKHISCYLDILGQHLREIGRSDLVPPDLNINVLMEFGVPAGTQLSMMGLGLSRTTALAIAEYIAADNWSEEECLLWLREGTWRDFEIPKLVKKEISTMLKKSAPASS